VADSTLACLSQALSLTTKSMKVVVCCALLLHVAASGFAAAIDDVYKLGPDSLPQPGVPQGRIIGPETLPSRIFTNTTRHYWIYVPAQYQPSKAAALLIFQDGHAFLNTNGDYRVPYVLDNLIYRREVPVTIAVFINPGRTPDQPESSSTNWGDSINNRGLEYNALDDKYARLIVDELLPAITSRYNISKNPEDRGIGGRQFRGNLRIHRRVASARPVP